MALSDTAIRRAKATGKAYTLSDDAGLSLAVSPKGGKTWHFRYYWGGKQKRISLGCYPSVTLREARQSRDQASALLAKGINPRAAREQQRYATLLASENSFETVFREWTAYRALTSKEGRKSPLSQCKRVFNNDVLPRIGKTSIYDVRRTDLLQIMSKIEHRGAFTVAEKVRGWLNQLFRFALVKVEGLENNPATDLKVVALPKPPSVHNPFLWMHEIPAFLQNLRCYPGQQNTQMGLRLLLLTGVRTGELRLATPEQFDLARGLWLIPPDNVKQLKKLLRKNGKHTQDIPPYTVPLSVQAIEIIRHLLGNSRPAQQFLLPHSSDLKKRMSENTLNQALKRMGYKDRLTGHGIRGTISTALHEIGYPKTWIEAQLSHTDPNKVSAAYNHAAYVEQRRIMMQDWADRLDLLEQGHIDAANSRLVIQIAGIPTMSSINSGMSAVPLQTNSGKEEMTITLSTPVENGARRTTFHQPQPSPREN
ncbi:integrase arm-type DNA-binding domain-containing protein [Acerihabitans arboris]|uniref:Tyrosine-type recombinase/integrase n=1 Tax=Acerihabitans arboris TaxID=2691583 RepID=A0A845SHT4_9GAMM|nr:tyrosine-type recombinase/integrase [Acerihabitans arboris]